MNIALLVGINSYQGNELRGCLNDVASLREVLCSCGFSPMHIRTLLDRNATSNNILISLNSMVEQLQEGDHGVFHFSGHGSQIPDCNGDNDEPDGLDEVLCPYLFDFTPSTTVSDDDLRRLLGKLRPGATIDVILDSCHSGTGTRDGEGIPRCIPFPIPLARSWHPKAILRELQQENVALWAGCKSNQTSADAFIDGKYRGAMTWAFCEVINKNLATKPGNIRRKDMIQLIREVLSTGYDQEPQLECSDDMKQREIFT